MFISISARKLVFVFEEILMDEKYFDFTYYQSADDNK